MSETRKLNPLIAAAAVSVIVFSALGIGVMTGLVPSSFSKSSETALEADAAKATDAKAAAAPSSTTKTQTKREPAKQPAQVASASKPAAATPAPAPVCSTCGVVAGVHAISQKGEGSGLGAVAGGLIGGVLGNQIGGGSGKKIATVAGVAGGAYAGHQVEKNMKTTTHYDVVVKMDDGSTRTFSYEAQPGFAVGSKVKVVNGMLVAG